MDITTQITILSSLLPDWHFERYGNSNDAVAAFPPKGTSLQAWNQIRPYATIWGVCGPFYSVRANSDILVKV